MRESFSNSIFSMARAVLKGKKIEMKSPDRAFSDNPVHFLHQKLAVSAIALSRLLFLHGHCLAIIMIFYPTIFLDIIFIFFRIEWCAFGFCN
jgi:hypothetical protein